MEKTILQNYIQNFLDAVQAGSLRNAPFNDKPPIDWQAYRQKILTEFESRERISFNDVDDVIHFALKELEDGHSFLLSPSIMNDLVANSPAPYAKLIGNVSYIRLPYFYYSTDERDIEYAETVQQEIARLDQSNPDGWIVDLRTNHGGTMLPMITGIGPLLGEGTHCYFANLANNDFNPVGYKDGALTSGDYKIPVVQSPYNLKKETPPIAVLSGEATGSSGEITLLAFRGLSNARIFGAPSLGQTTANMGCFITNTGEITHDVHADNLIGKSFTLAGSVYADRNKNLYGGKITPDFNGVASVPFYKILEESYSLEEDQLVQQAIGWINAQNDKSP